MLDRDRLTNRQLCELQWYEAMVAGERGKEWFEKKELVGDDLHLLIAGQTYDLKLAVVITPNGCCTSRGVA